MLQWEYKRPALFPLEAISIGQKEIKMLPNRFFTLAVIMSLVVVIALTVREAVTTSAIALDPEALEVHSLERSRAADTARWTAMTSMVTR